MILNRLVPAPWAKQFCDDYVPELLKLILSSWETFNLPNEYHENPITKKLCSHLRNNKNRDKHFFRIEWESTELDEYGNELGRIDLKFIDFGSCDEHVYFSIECKRLHVTFSNGSFASLAMQYVDAGMVRYFNGQYATDLNKGGMLGYVMDGNTEAAIMDIEKAIESRKGVLYMESEHGLKPSSLINNSSVKETHHSRPGKSLFLIHHVFLPIKCH